MSIIGRELPRPAAATNVRLPGVARTRPLPLANATLAAREDVTGTLAVFVVELDRPLSAYRPGQYVSLGIIEQGNLIQRPYSIVSRAWQGIRLELFVRRLPDGRFSNLLWDQEVGQRVFIGPAKGLFALDLDDRRPRVFVGTGTGVAPLLAMLEFARDSADQTPSAFVHGASFAHELHFADRVMGWRTSGLPLDYRPTISRPADERNLGWTGRTGRVEVQLTSLLNDWRWIRAGGGVAYICGNPEMVQACRDVLRDASFPEADIRVELFHAPGARTM